MSLSNQEAEHLLRSGIAALQQGRAAEARSLFEKVTETGRANSQIWLLLATACRADGDAAGQEAALDRLLVLDPRVVRAHVMKGDCRAQAGDDTGALNFYATARHLSEGQNLPADLATELSRVEAAAAQIKKRLEDKRDASLTELGVPRESRSPRFRQSLDILSGEKRIFYQEPTGYFFPGLPHVQFFDTGAFDWVAPLEAATGAICAELRQWLASGTEGFRPYITADPNRPRLDDNTLLDSSDWSALFLCENGKVDAAATARCPQTWAAIQAVPLPRIASSPTVMFSMLRAGAHIAAHTGTHNTRLVCHLPLVVPQGCRFRVGNETREWEAGKVIIFDDTIEHEAWNDSGEDRVVLIFDIWRPELSMREREEIGALFQSHVVE